MFTILVAIIALALLPVAIYVFIELLKICVVLLSVALVVGGLCFGTYTVVHSFDTKPATVSTH